MGCEKYEKLISLYLENDLDEEEIKSLEQHLESCESCRQQLEAIKYMQGMLKQDEDNFKPVNNIQKKVYAKIFIDLLIMFMGLVIIISVVAISGGLAQLFLLNKISAGISIIFLIGILLLIVGLIILMYDLSIDIFKIIFKK